GRRIRDADYKQPVHDLNAGLFGIAHRLLDLFQRLLLSQPIEHLLAATLDAEHERATVRFGHRGKQMLGDGVHPAFTAPLNRDVPVVEALSDGLDPFWLE